jgi:2-polyprenyl-3-methyl-5-hydroxy-6-metoxy-1,4-benzoquinol methylase
MNESPLNGSSDVALVESIATNQIINDWKTQFGIDITAELKGINCIEVLRCTQTDLVFFSPAGLAGSASLYGQLQRISWYYSEDKWEHKLAIGFLQAGSRVLEVGCGTGAFVALAKQAGFDIRGIELSAAAVETATSRGLPIILDDIARIADAEPGTFDAVCSFQVLEHVPNPRQFIEACVRAVRPGGLIVFGVPNGESFLKYTYDLLDLPPHHMSRWSEKTFRSLSDYFPVKFKGVFFQPLAGWDRDRYIRALSKRFRTASNLGGVITERLFRLYVRLGFRFWPSKMRGHSMCAVFKRT